MPIFKHLWLFLSFVTVKDVLLEYSKKQGQNLDKYRGVKRLLNAFLIDSFSCHQDFIDQFNFIDN
jgi:hypothetical protein